VHVKRDTGSSYRVVLSSVPENAGARPAAFFALIYPSNANRQITPDVLKQLYGLTPAQADVARSLFAGRSVEETAAHLDLSPNTVRTHLKHIFTRCEYSHQRNCCLLALGPYSL
jgi:DNA-binding CsgD family transcriptional regulator